MRGGDVCARAWPHHWLSEQVTDCWTEKKRWPAPQLKDWCPRPPNHLFTLWVRTVSVRVSLCWGGLESESWMDWKSKRTISGLERVRLWLLWAGLWVLLDRTTGPSSSPSSLPPFQNKRVWSFFFKAFNLDCWGEKLFSVFDKQTNKQAPPT